MDGWMYLESNGSCLTMYAEWIEGLKVELQASGRGGNIGEPQCEERTVWVKEGGRREPGTV